MRRVVLGSAGFALLIGGLLAISGDEVVGVWFRILPAFPFALLSNVFDESAHRGLFWDSAHSPPFLNALGLTVVYFGPGAVLVLLALIRGHGKSRAPGV